MKRIAMITMLIALVVGGVAAQSWSLQPTYGTVELESGFTPDPYRRSMTAGGSQSLDGIGYYGYVADAPDLDLVYEAGVFDLTIKVENTSADTVLLVNSPDGQWHFNDDFNGLDPSITFESPVSGMYNIWVGTFDGDFADSRLVITELGN